MSGGQIDCVADTSAIISLSRSERKAAAVLRDRNFAITFVTMAELFVGIYKSLDSELSYRKIEPIIAGRCVLYPTEATAPIYADLNCDLERRGRKIPSNDLWIAALALEQGVPLVARDAHFARVDGLTLIAC